MPYVNSVPRLRPTGSLQIIDLETAMTVPADQNFDNKTVFEHGSATFDGVTYFGNDQYAVLQTFSVTDLLPNAGNALAVGGDLLGFKTVDGSEFRLVSFTFLNATGECTFQGYRDGVLVASATELFPSGLGILSSVTLGSDFFDIDEFRLIDP